MADAMTVRAEQDAERTRSLFADREPGSSELAQWEHVHMAALQNVAACVLARPGSRLDDARRWARVAQVAERRRGEAGARQLEHAAVPA